MKVLVVRVDGVGDTILATPLLRALRACPDVGDLVALASPAGAPVLAQVPDVTRVITVDARDAPLGRRVAVAREVAREGFDAAICLSEKWWSRAWTRASGARLRVGLVPEAQPVARATLPLFFTHRVALPGHPLAPSPLHEVERYLELLKPLGVDGAPARFSLVVPEAPLRGAVQRIAQAVRPPLVPVGVHLSRKWATEGWHAGSVAGLCRTLLDCRPDCGLVLFHGPDDRQVAEAIALALDVADRGRILVVGSPDFPGWAALVAACRVVVTMDTATAHLSAALGVPVVDVFEDHRFEHCASRWAPWRVSARVLRREPIAPSAARPERQAAEKTLHGAIVGALGELL